LNTKMIVGVIFGGRSGEHEVSLMSATSVVDALDPKKYEVIQIGITHDGRWLSGSNTLQAFKQGNLDGLEPVVILPEPGREALYGMGERRELILLNKLDVVFPVLHGSFGEDGTLQGLLEMAEIAYVGAGVLASSVAMDKGVFKDVMQVHNIPVVDFTVLRADQIENDMDDCIRRAEALAPYPLFTKPANMGSSVGVSKVNDRRELEQGLHAAAKYDRRVLVERGVDAREIEVSVLGNEEPEASIAGEIVPGAEFYSYEAKYIDDTSDLHIPAQLDELTTEEIRRLAIKAFKVIDGAGMARVDFLLERETLRIYINELNTIPGFTKISMYPKLWQASGLAYPALMDRLIDLALQRRAQSDRLVRRYGEGNDD
jgi:D-alanine-D-alanine ligase